MGPLLWWYVPPDRWPEFFRHYGAELDSAVRDRLFWWTAEESLDVALSLCGEGYEGAVQVGTVPVGQCAPAVSWRSFSSIPPCDG